MLYTIGHKESYERGLQEMGEKFQKLGKCILEGKPYGGGAVFKTYQEADEFLDTILFSGYAVYGLEANWETDTFQVPEETCRRLLINSRIVHADVG